VLVPSALVEAGQVWVVAAGGRAERCAVEVGAVHGELVEVHDGLNLTDKLIDAVEEGGHAALADGDRVRIGGAR